MSVISQHQTADCPNSATRRSKRCVLALPMPAPLHLSPVLLGWPEPSAAEIQHALQEPALVPDFASAAVITPRMMAACDGASCHVESLVGARAYRAQRRCLQRRHAALCLVQDFAKELPEDELLDLGDIPGLVPIAQESFSYIREEVAMHLETSSPAVRQEVLQRLEEFESTVF